jgi:hypothetical protein
MAINVDRYSTIITNKHLFKAKKIETFVPMPDDTDYQIGYIDRYFVQKSNDNGAPIFEISKNQYTSYLNNPFFVAVSIVWRLVGTNDEISKSNLKSIKLGCASMLNLYLYLPNTLQFSKQ